MEIYGIYFIIFWAHNSFKQWHQIKECFFCVSVSPYFIIRGEWIAQMERHWTVLLNFQGDLKLGDGFPTFFLERA